MSSELQANEARFLFTTSKGKFSVMNFSGHESISTPYHFNIKLKAADSDIDPIDLIKEWACLTFVTQNKDERHINGILVCATLESKGINDAIYSVDLYPRFWMLSYNKHSRVFQNKTVPEIITEILKKNNLTSIDFQMNLSGNYPKRTYCIQWREKDIDFVSRLLSEEGIFYYFKQEQGRDVIVFGDDPSAHTDSSPESSVLYAPYTGSLGSSKETIPNFSTMSNIYTGKVKLNAYDHEQPKKNLKTENSGNENNELSEFDPIGGYKDTKHGDMLARRRCESSGGKSRIVKGNGLFKNFSAGQKINISENPDDPNGETYITREVMHKGEQTESSGVSYEGKFEASPSDVPVRPEEVIQKPKIDIQSATVIGPEGEDIYIDELGRVQIQFHWQDDENTCWVRVVQPWAGAGYGTFFMPRIGNEVLIGFIQGDPDNPIIIGCIYNGENLPPYGPEEKTVTAIKTKITPEGEEQSFNEIKINDQSDAEEISIHTPGILKIYVKKDKSEKIDGSKNIEVTGGHIEKIAEGMQIEVGGDLNETIGGEKSVTVTGKHDESTIEGYSLKAKNASITAEDEIKLIVGENSITISKDIIEIKALDLKITADSSLLKASGPNKIKGEVVEINCS